jgi:hypothetical protein
MIERMFQYASDLASLWLDYTKATMGQTPFTPPAAGRPPPSAAQHVGPFDLGGDAETQPSRVAQGVKKGSSQSVSEAPSVSVDILSKGRAEVTVDLKPGSAKGALHVHDLRASSPRMPRISGVTVEGYALENRVVVRLKLPDDQPAGTYTGVIVEDETNLPMGTVSVRVVGQADA